MAKAINQRDLRMRSREIMDAVEQGSQFLVLRDGRQIGELIPLRRRCQFVPRAQFVAMSTGAPSLDLDRFRSDLDFLDQELGDPYDR